MKLCCTKYMLFLAVALLLLGVAACTQSKPVVPTATLPLTTPGLPPPAVGTNPAATSVGPAGVTQVPAGTPQPGATVPPGQVATVQPGQPTMLPTPTLAGGQPQPTQPAQQQPGTEATPVPGTEPSSPPATTGGTCSNPYIVQRGEWLYSIARKCGVTPGAILAANPGINPNYLYPGQSLNMPGGGTSGGGTTPSGGTSGNTYIVKPGDTMYSIATRHNTTVAALMAANGISNPNFIFAGQVLTIP